MKIEVQSGDITRVKTDALITAINSGGMWFGGIDGVIQRAAGNLFHAKAQQAMPLTDGQTVVADHGTAAHDAAFANVVFVVDDLKQSLRDIVYEGLKAASDAGYKSVSLPTIRMGVMLGAVEKSKQEAVDEMAVASPSSAASAATGSTRSPSWCTATRRPRACCAVPSHEVLGV